MKKMFRLAAMFLMAGAMLTACGGDDNETKTPGGGGGGGEEGKDYPETVKIATATEGEVKAGLPDQITIEGEGFEPDVDLIFVGYEEGGKTQFIEISKDVLTQTKKRVTFGVHIADDIVNQTIKVYLDRPGYDKMPLTKDITFRMPEVSEGYIPDPAFRATLMSISTDDGNPAISVLFDKFGLIDPARAAEIRKCGAGDYGLNLYSCKAKSLEGIELFKSIEGTVPLWLMDQIEEIDLSKWEGSATGFVALFADNANNTGLPKLKKFIGGPILYRVDLYKNDKLEYVDLSRSKWCYNVQLFYDDNPNGSGYSNVTYLDLRKDRTGTEMGGQKEGAADWKGYPHSSTEYAPFLTGAWFKPADNCHILIDYQFLTDKWTDGNSGYGCVYSAWQRGATVDVYSSKDNSKKLGTVPMYSVDNGALTPAGQENGWVPAETE